jgi:hypothetical protein
MQWNWGFIFLSYRLYLLVTLCLNPYWLEQLLRVVTSWNFFLQISLIAAVSVSYARFFFLHISESLESMRLWMLSSC